MRGSTYDPFKRVFDFLVAGILLVVTAPFQAVVAVMVNRKLGSPVLFRQERPGKDEQIFELVKFRTMLDVDESAGLITDEQRLTRFGSLLRSTSLDELPTLWNVVKGEMSLVGPRPLRVSYLEHYNAHQSRRHEVRPGVTGLAQVKGRNAITWEDKFDFDVEYVDKRSLFLDFKVLFETVKVVALRTGISHEGHVTMTKFEGTEED